MKIVATSDIKTDANTLKGYLDELNGCIKDIEGYADQNAMNQIWAGSDSEAFVGKYKNEVLPKLNEYKKHFEEYYEYLKIIYEIFETLDESYNKQISTN